MEMENECQAYDTTPQDISAEDDETKALLPTSVCELLDPPQPVTDTKDCDTKTSQLINDEQNNNHVEKSPIKNDSYDYQKYDSSKEVSFAISLLDFRWSRFLHATATKVSSKEISRSQPEKSGKNVETQNLFYKSSQNSQNFVFFPSNTFLLSH